MLLKALNFIYSTDGIPYCYATSTMKYATIYEINVRKDEQRERTKNRRHRRI